MSDLTRPQGSPSPRHDTSSGQARLAGVTATGNAVPCALVFELETEDGQSFQLTQGTLLAALRFAQDEALMPALSEDWWARSGENDGCSV